MRGAWILLGLVACGDNLRGNRAPTAEDFNLTTQEDIPISKSIDATDLDGDDLVALTPLPPMHGTATSTGLTITYKPDPDFHGDDQFIVPVSDGVAEINVTVRVTVTSVNDSPFGVTESIATDEDTPRSVPVSLLLANDSDNDGDTLTITAVGTAVNGTVDLTSGVVTFTPDANFTGEGSFLYDLTDGIETVQVPVSVAVDPQNDPPVAVDDAAATTEDTAKILTTLDLTANDTDPENQVLTISAVQNATNGTVSLDTNSGDVTFTPDANFNGAASFEYVVSDGIATDTGLVTVTVTAVNDPPIANPDTVDQNGNANAILHTTLLANDSDGGDGAALTITAVASPVNGTVTLEATTVTFTPDNGFSGTASFDYTISDGGATTSTATVTVNVATARVCGDSVIGAPETCDDGGTATGDGCDGNCKVEPGFTCTGAPSACTPICGDAQVVGTEPCDDGNADETDGCTSKCVVGVICNATAFPGGDRFAVDPATGNCFVSFDDDLTTFTVAEAACEATGGHLATIASPAENAIVHSVQNTSQNPWIGATDDANDTDAVFDWVTDEPFVFSLFANGEPDDDVGIGGNGECLDLANAAGEWGDTNCNLNTFVVGRICEIEVGACGDSIVQPTEECDDSNNIDGDGCSSNCQLETLFFSEYVEGSGSNKALEIRNPSATVTDKLAGCFIRTTFQTGSTQTLALPPLEVPPNDVLVICNSAGVDLPLAQCDLSTNAAAMTFNGDDSIELICNGTTLDVIGQPNFDPGTQWGSGNVTSTEDNTIRRKCFVHHGDTDRTDDFEPTLAAQWVGFAQDDFSGLGSTACAP